MGSSSRQILLTLAAVAAMGTVACRPAKPPTVVPPAPVVSSFTTSATEVAPNSEVTLSWKVEHASSISLNEASTGKVGGVADDAFESSVKVTITRSSVFVLTARGEAGSDTRIVNVKVAGTSATVLFRALPEKVLGGESATLVWSAPGYGSVTITDDANQTVALGGQLESGSVSVVPRRTTTYTLKAGDKTLTAQVRVAPNVLTFTSSAPNVQAGDMVTLSWTTAGATKVILSAAGRGDLHTVTSGAAIEQGTFVDTVPLTAPNNGLIAYTLTVEGDGAAASRPLTVYVGSGLTITAFNVPPVAKASSSATVTWTTSGADQVEILVDGAPRYRTANATDVSAGNFGITTPGADFVITLRATNARGGNASRSAPVDVVAATGMPTIAATPTSVAVGTAVALTFTAPNSRFTQIVDQRGAVVLSARGLAAESGTAQAYPSENTVYTVIADNTVGDPIQTASTSTITVTGARPTMTFTGGTPAAGVGAQLVYAPDPAAILYGLPHTNVVTGSGGAFIDIKTTGTRFGFTPTADDAVAFVDPGFQTRLFGNRLAGEITVSTNGWMAFNTVNDNLGGKETIPSHHAPSNTIAPYWDDLELNGSAGSGIYWEVQGTAPNRTLIVQWEGMRHYTETTGNGSFQVQVEESGEVSFHYRDMVMPASTSFTVGVQGAHPSAGVAHPSRPANSSSLYFFSPVTSPVTTQVFAGVEYSAAVAISGAYMDVAGPRAVRLNQELSIVEVNAQPLGSVSSGEWLEIQNRSPIPVNLSGWRLTTPDAGSFTFDGGVVPPLGFLVVGSSTDPALNDDAGVQVSWDGQLSLPDRAGSVRLEYSPDAGLTLAYDGGSTASYDAGVSYMVDPGPYTITGSPTLRSLTCVPAATYGVAGQRGTPGAQNSCGFPYGLQSVTGSYYDISKTGTRVFNQTSQVLAAVADVTFPTGASAPAPVYFGQSYATATISVNGWLSFTITTLIGDTNKTSPAAATTTNPTATIAPFWDDLETVAGYNPASDVYYKRVAANEDPRNPAPHWIVQWHHVATEFADDDDLNFQVKFFDDGVIEYHYARMTSGSTSDYGTGTSATVWLENPTGTIAATVSASTAGSIWPNSAYRFTPR